jgi:hypothetical protein
LWNILRFKFFPFSFFFFFFSFLLGINFWSMFARKGWSLSRIQFVLWAPNCWQIHSYMGLCIYWCFSCIWVWWLEIHWCKWSKISNMITSPHFSLKALFGCVSRLTHFSWIPKYFGPLSHYSCQFSK